VNPGPSGGDPTPGRPRGKPEVVPFDRDRGRADGERSAPRSGGAGRFGMALFLVSLAMLFGSSMLAILIVRFRTTSWSPAGWHGAPVGLWASTLVILAASVAVHRALRAARGGDLVQVERGLVLTLMAGCGFLLLQALNWLLFLRAGGFTADTLVGFSFYVLTGLHGLHVLGGLVALGLVLRGFRRGRWRDRPADPVQLTAMYWHFLDAAWLVMFTVILVLF